MLNLARITAPLHLNVGNDQSSAFRRLNETEMEVGETLQHLLLSPPILSLLSPDGSNSPDTNACD